jgi:small nuclear ribonucleoprotein (snRNP)-like protein
MYANTSYSFENDTHWRWSLQFPISFRVQLFYSFFRSLVGKTVTVELKNDLALRGELHSVDQYLNIKLLDIEVVDAERFPQLVSRFTLLARIVLRNHTHCTCVCMSCSCARAILWCIFYCAGQPVRPAVTFRTGCVAAYAESTR